MCQIVKHSVFYSLFSAVMKAITFFRAQSRSPYNGFRGRSLLYKLWFKVTYGQAIKVLVGKETGAKGKIELSPNKDYIESPSYIRYSVTWYRSSLNKFLQSADYNHTVILNRRMSTKLQLRSLIILRALFFGKFCRAGAGVNG